MEYSQRVSTIREPILTVQDVLCFGVVGVELAQTVAEGQSPQEQPREVSPHE